MFIRTQNIYSLNNPVHLAILLILVQTINKNFTHPPTVWEIGQIPLIGYNTQLTGFVVRGPRAS